MKAPLLACFVLLSALACRANDAAPASATAAIRELLADFLTNNSDPVRHQKFWADDLVYTSALGIVRDKPEIMKSVRATTAPAAAPAKNTPSQPAPAYTAEDIVIRPYDGFAALTFRLVARNPDGTTDTYRNSGTLVYRDNRWQVITWQATKVPPAEAR